MKYYALVPFILIDLTKLHICFFMLKVQQLKNKLKQICNCNKVVLQLTITSIEIIFPRSVSYLSLYKPLMEISNFNSFV